MLKRFKDWHDTRAVRQWLIRLTLQTIAHRPQYGVEWAESDLRCAVKSAAIAAERAGIGCRRPSTATDVRWVLDTLVRRGTLVHNSYGEITHYKRVIRGRF